MLDTRLVKGLKVLYFTEQDGILIALKFDLIALEWVILVLTAFETRASKIFAKNLKSEWKNKFYFFLRVVAKVYFDFRWLAILIPQQLSLTGYNPIQAFLNYLFVAY